MNKENFMAKQSTLHNKYVQILLKYFTESINLELLNINHLAATYDIESYYGSLDYVRDIYKSFNSKMRNDVTAELKKHYVAKGWSCNFAVSTDEDSDRLWIICHARFTI